MLAVGYLTQPVSMISCNGFRFSVLVTYNLKNNSHHNFEYLTENPVYLYQEYQSIHTAHWNVECDLN